MNYIYDIILNFQNKYYNFFEWNKTDKLQNINKIPLYRISDKDILILRNNSVQVTKEFINTLKKDTTTKKLICLVSNNKIAIALLFNEEGYLLKRSSLIFEEEEEVIDEAKYLKETKIEYLKNQNIQEQNKLRIEKERKKEIIEYINNTNNFIALKYLYYEYYEKENNNPINIKETLLKELTKEWNTKQNKLYKIINMLQKIK